MKIKYVYLVQSTIYFKEIVRINRLLKKQNINFLFLKGLPLHLYYEKSYPKRIYKDCDFLIAKKDYKKAIQTLQESGYKRIDDRLSAKITRAKGQEIEISFRKLINNVPVILDIHFGIPITMVHLNKLEPLYRQKLTDDLTLDFLDNKKQIMLNGISFSVLNSNYLIIYLAIHFFQHNYRGAFRLELLNKIIKAEKKYLKDDRMRDIIKKYRLENFVYPSFFLVKKFFKSPISKRFLKTIKPLCGNRTMFSPYNYIYKYIIPMNIFTDESRLQAGINRFKNLFFLSPQPLWRKSLVFFNPQVIFSIIWVILAGFNKRFFYKKFHFVDKNTT